MLHYRIADLHIAVQDLPGMAPLESFAPFAVPEAPADLTYTIKSYALACPPVPDEAEMDLVSEDIVNRLYLKDDILYKRIAMREGDLRCIWTVMCMGDWSQATIYMPEDWLDYDAYGNAFTLEKTILPFHGLLLHCALIDYQGHGIAFTAPSQTGKSTQANLWCEHMGAEILNGDRAILRAVDGGIYAYGSPWAGSSDYRINRRVKLDLIVVLEQAKENRIRTLSHGEALNYILQQSSLPMWEPNLMEFGMETLETLLTQVPAHMLSCRIDREAVELVHACLK